jgi:hypothetical protein
METQMMYIITTEMVISVGIIVYLVLKVAQLDKRAHSLEEYSGTTRAELKDLYGLTGFSKPKTHSSGYFIMKDDDVWMVQYGHCVDILEDGCRVFEYKVIDRNAPCGWTEDVIKVPKGNCYTTEEAAIAKMNKLNYILDVRDEIDELKNKKLTKKK